VSVLVRGAGVVSALGPGRESLWDGLATGRRALEGTPPTGRVDRARARAALPAAFARAESPEEVFLALALAEALEAAGLDAAALGGETPVIVGTTKGSFAGVRAEGPLGAPARFLAGLLAARGEVLTLSQACASASAAIAHGAALVASGETERAVVAGVEALTPFVEDGFASLQALDRRGARPFDRTRAGLSLGEGAGVLILEGRASGPGTWLRGAASASDAHSSTSPHPEGRGLERALRLALARGGLAGSEVALVCAHGTGTERNDAAELAALDRVLEGSRARVFSVKGNTGHALGAAGAIDAIAACLALEHRSVPGTAGLEDPLETRSLRLTRTLEPVPGRHALSVNAGFGGLNAVLAFERVP
jgi:3-oxoacyl-(acyl-carrier-protein) synthase